MISVEKIYSESLKRVFDQFQKDLNEASCQLQNRIMAATSQLNESIREIEKELDRLKNKQT